jgi:diguanylate cyclase (GGDEF)-like protein
MAETDFIPKEWKAFDFLIDAVFICKADGSLHYANESFFNLCQAGERVVRSHRDVRSVITLPEFCWTAFRSEEFSYSGYQEVEYQLPDGAKGHVQVCSQRLIQSHSSGQSPFFLFILHDVTIEVRIHTKYRAQIAENERLIQQLDRNLKQSNLIREIAVNVPLQTGNDELLTTLSTRMRETFEFTDVHFFPVDPHSFMLKPLSLTTRLGSRLRLVHERLTEWADRGAEMVGGPGACHRIGLAQLGTGLVCLVKPRLEEPRLLYIGLGKKQEEQNFDPIILMLCEQLESLLDNRMLQVAATTDPLTGVFNRRYYDSRVIIECGISDGGHHPLSLLLFDIDHFKSVNDRYGHPAGDQVLKVMGGIMRSSCRGADIPVRLGGEEFALLLPSCAARDSVVVAERIRLALAETVIDLPDQGTRFKVTTSCGIAEVAPGSETPELLYKAADKALYAAKHGGRNRTVVEEKTK